MKSGKNICISVGIFPPDVGGPASYVPKIASHLSSEGHKVAVVCLSDCSAKDLSYPFSITRISRGLFKPLRYLLTVNAIFRASKSADILFVNGLGIESMIATFLRGIPRTHKVVGDLSWERARSYGWFPGTIDEYQVARKNWKFRFLDALRNFPLWTAEKIIVPSEYLKKIVMGWGVSPEKILVVYNAVEPIAVNGEKRLPLFNGKTILTACRLTPWKGVDGIIRALSKIPEARLIVAGEGPMRAEWNALSLSLGVADRVLWLGDTPRVELLSYMSQADVFVLNSTYEGLPHVILEAIEAGAPVVATRVGGTGEIIQSGKSGILVSPGDEEALTLAIKQILQSPEKRESFIRAASQSLLAKFSFPQMVRSTEQCLVGDSR
jgi:glycosyltransferase involved in cell wall biosynthesis